MPFLVSMKGPFLGLVLVISYASMIMDIIGELKVVQGDNQRSPGVIAALTGAACQAIWCALYVMTGAKGPLFKAISVVSAMFAFFVWQIVVIPIIFVYNKRSLVGYCAPENAMQSLCDGTFKGVVGLGFCVAFIDLIYIGFIVALVASSGASFSDELHDIPAREKPVDERQAKA